ncbi:MULTISPECIES: cell division protein FtsZ [unclassified Wenzhouxiangella]|uniref:cell division protein FtsZ n=1 Tax=unclassified Wenzhouxiangella TaxID=2613841 RepID=UPI000E328266|nr:MULTISPECIES: cell division protein FtsZ [unclassified Wenzhouxiangella]RFF28748.1 cell division protein FtsZ [Wenzhouxiangella sp. 15181]RFP67849.1 cell division protein FtsZ [Wenzhouxiangella sp. 15190]
MPFELIENYTPGATIKVVGIGGGGGNAVNQMVEQAIEGVEFICVNTDSQALRNFSGKSTLQIGSGVTKGLGAGANPEVGRQAALEDRDRISEMLEGCDMVFITAGMGGGTGTGAAPVVAQTAKEMGILTVAVVTRPFPFEGQRRGTVAKQGIDELSHHVDSLITIPNGKLLSVLGGEVTLLDAFKSANQVLSGAVQGIAELITRPGLINVDFADVRTVMSEMGMAMMGAGTAKGEDRALMAAQSAIGSPLLEDVDLNGACGILVNVTAGMNLSMKEFEEVGTTVADLASEDATVVIGTVIDPDMNDELRVTVVATGLGSQRPKREERPMEVVRTGTDNRAAFTATEEEQRAQGTGDRRQSEPGESRKLFGEQKEMDYLDIPAFLRNQAD